MSQKGKTILVFMVLLSLLLIPVLANALAYSYITYTYPVSIVTGLRPENQGIVASNGKYVYVTIDSSTFTMYAYITKSDGTVDGTVSMTLASGYSAKTIAVTSFNATHVLIMGGARFTGNYLRVFCILLHINAHTYTTYLYVTNLYGAPTTGVMRGGEIFVYNSNYYYVFMNWQDSTIRYLTTMNFTTSTYIVKGSQISLPATATASSPVIGFQPNNTYPLAWVLFADDATNTQPSIYTINLYHPSSSVLLAVTPNSDRYNSSRNLRLISGGLVVNGSHVFMYFTWVYPTQTYLTRQFRVVQTRIDFSNFSTRTISSQNQRYYTVACSAPLGVYELPIIAAWSDAPRNIHFIGAYYYGYGYATLGTAEYNVTIPDWFDMSSTSLGTWTTTYPNVSPIYSISEIMLRVPSAQFQSNELAIQTYLHVYYGLPIVITDVDITLTYTPYDSPPLIRKQYYFTGTVTVNGYPMTTGTVTSYFNSVEGGTNIPNADGEISFGIIQNVAGAATIRLEAFNEYGVSIKNQTFYYTWVTVPTTPYSPETSTAGSIAFFNAMPLLMILIIPTTVLGFLTRHPAGFVLGFLVGGSMAVFSGILPFYYLFLFAIGIIMVLLAWGRS